MSSNDLRIHNGNTLFLSYTFKKVKLIVKRSYLFFFLIILIGCSDETLIKEEESESQNLTIFFVNDQHGELTNFAKIKHIVDEEELKTNVIVACSGDIFSGNPIVDNHEQKGFPMIDLMNRVGFDISVLGNHEFDYGEAILKDRINQSQFDWICANVDMGTSGVPEPLETKTINVGNLKITFLGLIETSGNGDIPLTHPWRVKNINFMRPETVVGQYSEVKEHEQSDLLIALTHLGHNGFGGILGDFQLAEQFSFFDLIIGGHSNQLLHEVINGIPVFQAGNDLNYLGKIELSVKNRSVETIDYELIDLNAYQDFDLAIKELIDEYESSMPELDEVIGYSHLHHPRSSVGCFYTDALKGDMMVDISFQNTGGIRSSLDEGDITRREIYEIDPFNNGTVNYTMTVEEIKHFLRSSGSGFYYSGLQINQIGNQVEIRDANGTVLSDDIDLSVGINDFIPAIFESYFPEGRMTFDQTTAESIISYLEEQENQVNYTECSRFFRYQ